MLPRVHVLIFQTAFTDSRVHYFFLLLRMLQATSTPLYLRFTDQNTGVARKNRDYITKLYFPGNGKNRLQVMEAVFQKKIKRQI